MTKEQSPIFSDSLCAAIAVSRVMDKKTQDAQEVFIKWTLNTENNQQIYLSEIVENYQGSILVVMESDSIPSYDLAVIDVEENEGWYWESKKNTLDEAKLICESILIPIKKSLEPRKAEVTE